MRVSLLGGIGGSGFSCEGSSALSEAGAGRGEGKSAWGWSCL